MLNDAAGDLKVQRRFHIKEPAERIMRACQTWQQAGIATSLTTWVVPRPDWIRGMRDVGALATATQSGLTLDPEEPWTVRLRGNPARAEQVSAELLASVRSTFSCELAAAPIVYADHRVLAPLLGPCDVLIPQCYANLHNARRRAAGELERIALQRYRPYGRPIILGAAAWKLEGAYRLPRLAAARASLTAARDGGVEEVRYWRLDFLEADHELCRTIRNFVRPGVPDVEA